MYNLNDMYNSQLLFPPQNASALLMGNLLGQQGIILLNFIQNNNITYSCNPNNSLTDPGIFNKSLLDSANAQINCNPQSTFIPYFHGAHHAPRVERNEFISNLVKDPPPRNSGYNSFYRNNQNENLFDNEKYPKTLSLENRVSSLSSEIISNKCFTSVNVDVNSDQGNKSCKNCYDIDNANDSLIKSKLNNEISNVKEKRKPQKKKKIREKKYECKFENCKKSFEYKWILNRHLNSHFCFRLFKCESCSKAYKSKENLNLHVKNKHLGLKPYNCDFCDSRFSHRNGKTYHERKIHLKILPFTCTFEKCESCFASKSALNYHLRYQH